MGTTCAYKPQGLSVRDYLIRETLVWRDTTIQRRVLDTAFVNLSEFYAAIEVLRPGFERRVFAVIYKVKMFKEARDGTNICWKDMSEDMGPYLFNCPPRILDLLTPTEDKTALEWRAKCRQRIAQLESLPRLRLGTTIHFDPPVAFSYFGHIDQLRITETKGNRIICSDTHGAGRFRMSRNWLKTKLLSGEAQTGGAS